MFLVRGAAGSDSNQILFMVNSQIVNDPINGAGIGYLYLDLDNVKQIEFVTGPGSALYGSGAMAGIINIITKEGDDVDGMQLTGRGGSYHTWEGNALLGKNIEGLEVAAYVDYFNTDGFSGHVEQDRQTVWDQQYGTHASLAPGNMRTQADQWDAQLTMKYKGFKFDGKFLSRMMDEPFGWQHLLDNISDRKNQEYYLNLSYDTTIIEGLDLMVKGFRNQYSDSGNWGIIPKGALALTPTGPAIMSDNKIAEWTEKSRRTGAEAQTTYEIVDSNTIVGGITFEKTEVYGSTTKGNILPTSIPDVVIPLPTVQDWPADLLRQDQNRDIWAAYVEDLWDILEDLRLTIGGRYDHYSDFGGQFSPRVGLNWDFAKNYYAKFLYGRAFRAPTFNELYHPVDGNPDLEPVTKDTYELNFGARFFPSFSAQITGYYFKGENEIGFELIETSLVSKYTNLESSEGKGFQLQMKYDFGRGTYLSMNYTYQDLELWEDYGQPKIAWWEPKHIGTLSGNIRLNRYLNLNSYLIYRGGWTRSNGDTREDPGDYALVNATLIARNFSQGTSGP